MTTVEKLDFFDLIQDKFGSPYFNEAQKLVFLNRAAMRYVENLFPKKNKRKDGDSVEATSIAAESVKELIYVLPAVTMDASGEITNSSMVTALRTLSGDSNADIFKILSVEIVNNGKKIPLRSMRHNDKAAFETNIFKKPTYTYPRYSFANNALQFRPDNAVGDIYVTVIKTPKIMTSVVNTDLNVDTHNEIVAQAIAFAGIASRDDVLVMLNSEQL